MSHVADTREYNSRNDSIDADPEYRRRSNWPAERIFKPTPDGWVNPCDGADKCRRTWFGGCGPGCLTRARMAAEVQS